MNKKLLNMFNVLKKYIIKNKRIFIIGLLIIIPLIVFVIFTDTLNEKYKNSKSPYISLLGEKIVELKIGEKYIEKGAKAYDGKGKDITKNIIILGNVNSEIEGTYYIYYNVKNIYGINAKEQVRVVMVGENENKAKSEEDEEEALKRIVEKVVTEHKNDLIQFGDVNCDKVDYLYPIVLEYFEEDEQPDRETIRPIIKNYLTEKGL